MRRMWKCFALFFVLNLAGLPVPRTACGEISARSRLHWGPKLGLNLGLPEYDPVPANTIAGPAGGLGAGAFLRYKLSGKLALQPELLLMMKGLELRSNAQSTRAEETVRLNYLDIPVLLRWTPKGEPGRFKLFAGPVVSLLLGAKSDLEAQGGTFGPNEVTIEIDIKEQMRSFDFGATAGMGLDFPSGFLIEARYFHGFTDVSKSGLTRIQNKVISLLMGWTFPL